MVCTNVATEIWDVKSLCLNSLENIFRKVQIAVFQNTLFSEFSVRGFRIAAFGISQEFPDTFYPGIHERFQRLRAGEYLSVACPEIVLLYGSRLGNRFEELSCVHCCIVWFVPRGGIAPPRPCRGLGECADFRTWPGLTRPPEKVDAAARHGKRAFTCLCPDRHGFVSGSSCTSASRCRAAVVAERPGCIRRET